jgi:hypothetical protein
VRRAGYRLRNQAYIVAYLRKHPCIDCGVSDPVVLEFDHVRGQKRSDISTLVRNAARLDRVAAEIAKCVVRCANCHRRRTARVFWEKHARLEEGLSPAMAD